ncbi:uncharacterized protein LOC144441029 [Glandiceps talaboti]
MKRQPSRMPSLLCQSVPGEEYPNQFINRPQSTLQGISRNSMSIIGPKRENLLQPSRLAGALTVTHNPPPVSSLTPTQKYQVFSFQQTGNLQIKDGNTHSVSLQSFQHYSQFEGNETGYDDEKSASFQANLFCSDVVHDDSRPMNNSDYHQQFIRGDTVYDGNRNMKKFDKNVLYRNASMQTILPNHRVKINRNESLRVPVIKPKTGRLQSGCFSRSASVPPSLGNNTLPNRQTFPGRSLTGTKSRQRKHVDQSCREVEMKETKDQMRKMSSKKTQATENNANSHSFWTSRWLLLLLVTSAVLLAVLLMSQNSSVQKEINLPLGLTRSKPVNINTTELDKVLQKSVFGQHIVNELLSNVITNYAVDDTNVNPLVLAFHGGVGTGKTMVTEILSDHLFKKQKLERCMHRFVSSLDFPHDDKVAEYKTVIVKVINSTTRYGCKVRFLVFDEIDSIPLSLLPVLIDVFKGNSSVIENGKVIYILESNLFGKEIIELMVQRYFQGKSFDSVTLDEIKGYLYHTAFRETVVQGSDTNDFDHMNGYLIYTVLKSTIDFMVPFLPLTKHHVKQCIEKDLRQKGYQASKEIVDRVTDQLQYFPLKLQWFSVNGCKGVSSYVDLMKI